MFFATESKTRLMMDTKAKIQFVCVWYTSYRNNNSSNRMIEPELKQELLMWFRSDKHLSLMRAICTRSDTELNINMPIKRYAESNRWDHVSTAATAISSWHIHVCTNAQKWYETLGYNAKMSDKCVWLLSCVHDDWMTEFDQKRSVQSWYKSHASW